MRMHWGLVVIEVAAAVVSAAITAGAMGASQMTRRANEGRDAVIRLTVSVDNVANRLDALHTDIKSDHTEVYSRIRELEAAVSRLEARST